MSDAAGANAFPDFAAIPAAALLRELFDQADVGMSFVDIETRRFLRVNARFCEITGHSAEQLLEMTAPALTHPDDRASDKLSFERFIRGEIARRVVEKRYLRRDGTSIWVRITTTVVQFGNARCAFGITEDISARRATLAALKAAEQRKNEFVAMLAHELRNPLASIRNSSRVLAALPYTDDHFRQVRDVIERQSQNLTRLVDDLLDSARIDSGKVALHKQHTRLADVIDEALETVTHQLHARKHELKVSLASSEIWLDADRLRLVQAFGNLLSNAIKYTPERGRIAVEVNVDGPDVLVDVSDNGIGIAPQALPHIFKLFEQAGHTPERSQGGLGIGLSVAKRLIELHDGGITVHSDPGAGSTFRIRLPRSDRRAQPAQVPAVIESPSAEILIVEDNADVADTLALLLRTGGHRTHIAHDGASAMRAIEELVPDVALIDVGLPDLDGRELAKRLRKRESTRACFMVAISGYGEKKDIELSIEAGFNHHLVKPVNYDTLLALLSGDRRAAAPADV